MQGSEKMSTDFISQTVDNVDKISTEWILMMTMMMQGWCSLALTLSLLSMANAYSLTNDSMPASLVSPLPVRSPTLKRGARTIFIN